MLTLHLESAHQRMFLRLLRLITGHGAHYRASDWETPRENKAIHVYDRRLPCVSATKPVLVSFCYAQMHRVRTFVGRNFSRWSYVSKYKYFL